MKLLMIGMMFIHAGVATGADGKNSGSSTGQNESSTSTPVTLNSILAPVSPASTGVNSLRTQMLTEGGRTAGFRGGMISRAHALAAQLDQKADRLSRIFQFATLIDPNGTLPPVIVEAKDVAAFSPDQIRTADHVYKIQRNERFVSVPPTWRDYLYTGLPIKGKVELPTLEARPKDSREEALWRDAVKAGWGDGEKQADAVLDANFNRLTRDYSGMLLYASLRQQGIVSGTRVAELAQTVTGDQRQLIVGDKLRRVTEKAQFVVDPRKWRATVKAEPSTRDRSHVKSK